MTKIVKIKTVNVGQNFATIGVLVARNGRRVAETEAYPHGFVEAARAGAEALAGKMGLSIAAVQS